MTPQQAAQAKAAITMTEIELGELPAGSTKIYLEALSTFMGTPYSLNGLILNHGTVFHAWANLGHYPTWIKYDRPRRCYANAANMAMDSPATGARALVYCEGLAFHPVQSWVGPIPHAWVAEQNTGLILDPTWGHRANPGNYYGIPFRRSYLSRYLLAHGTYAVLANPREVRRLIVSPSVLRRATHTPLLARLRTGP